MQVSLEHGFAFLCARKCASHSIEDVLRPHVDMDLQGTPEVRHTNVRQYHELIAPYLSEVAPDQTIETVALVREPVSWLHSWYRFRARRSLRSQHPEKSTAHLSFDGFVEGYLSDPRPEFAQVGSQADFLTREDGSLGVDHLYAYENLPKLVTWLSRRVGTPLSLRSINVSPTKVHQSSTRETVSALKRRIRDRVLPRLSPRSSHTAVPDPRHQLSPDLLSQLTTRLRRDIELHEIALERAA